MRAANCSNSSSVGVFNFAVSSCATARCYHKLRDVARSKFINFCARFIDFGEIHSAIEITEPKEVYHVGSRCYIRGESASFECKSNWFWKELKDSGGEYIRIPGSEKGSRYHELTLASCSSGKRYILNPAAEWLTDLPSEPSELIVSFDKNLPGGLCSRKTEYTVHALYAYPLAAVAFVAVDVPSALIYSAWGSLWSPYVLMK